MGDRRVHRAQVRLVALRRLTKPSGEPGLHADVVAETIALGKRPATWVLLGIWNIMAVMFGYVIPYVSRNDAAGVNGTML